MKIENENSYKTAFDWSELGRIKSVSKGTLHQTTGVKSSKAFFVKKGLLKSYSIDDNGKIHVFMFAPEDWIITDFTTNLDNCTTELFIDAVEDSEIIVLTDIINNVTDLKKEIAFSEIQKLLKRLAILQRRIIMLMSTSAKKRYENFVEDYPQLINRIPLKMIASYLGITPEALSNIRKKLRNQEI
jgi:CRP-like cAMP-binding protein